MFRLLIVGLQLVAFFSSCEALTCVECTGDADKCADSKQEKECSEDEVCQSFFQRTNNKDTVTKSCKQRPACEHQTKNPDNDCDADPKLHAPCRCCCDHEDFCNGARKGCIVENECGKPKTKNSGSFDCPEETELGSVCTFTCPADYDIVGAKNATCIKSRETGNRIWSPINQLCKKIRCDKISAPKNGDMNCINKGSHENQPGYNFLDTECTFKCHEGYKLKGAQKTVCQEDNTWSKKVPKCVIDPCKPILPAPNRNDNCTDHRKQGSVCTFKCKKGYKLVGEEATECVSEKGVKKVWDRKPPTCILVKCLPEQTDPTHGSVSCDNKNFENSVCTFTCHDGYDLDGTTATTKTRVCEDGGDGDEFGEWTNLPATCSPIQCIPRLNKHGNGSVKCTESNFLKSVCSFKCDEGYTIVGTSRSVFRSICKNGGNGDTRGEWSRSPPTCIRVRCLPPHKNPENGRVICSDENYLKSVCNFRCNKGYDLDGTNHDSLDSECEEDGNGDEIGEWSTPPPTCSPIKCELVVGPENGSFRCTNDNAVGSICTFECEYGYQLTGERKITCDEIKRERIVLGEWSSKVPGCSRIFCSAQKHDSTVTQTCEPPGTDKFGVGTTCTYTCAEEGHYLVSNERPTVVERSGSLAVKCSETSNWDREAPTCIRVKCQLFKTPQNAFPQSCTDGNWLGSVCGFKCLQGYAPTHNDSLVCESDGTDADKTGRWNKDPPRCEINECRPLGEVQKGKFEYSNGFKVDSVANLTCDNGYTLKRHESSVCRQKDGKKEPAWSRLPYVDNLCCVKCIFNDRLRIVTVVDKTAAQNAKDWKDIYTWHTYLLDYLFTKDYKIKFGLVLYDDTVDAKNSIDETKLTKLSEVEDIQNRVKNLPYGGRDSDTASALDYAKSTYFSEYSSKTRRTMDEPYIIVIKRPGSGEDASEAAKRILDDKIHVMALGFQRENYEDEAKELAKLTGDLNRVKMIRNETGILGAAEEVTEISKAVGCSSASKNQKCV